MGHPVITVTGPAVDTTLPRDTFLEVMDPVRLNPGPKDGLRQCCCCRCPCWGIWLLYILLIVWIGFVARVLYVQMPTGLAMEYNNYGTMGMPIAQGFMTGLPEDYIELTEDVSSSDSV